MTKDEFIKRIEEVGFVRKSGFFFLHDSLPYSLCIYSNKDWFNYGVCGYTFDELEQFLIEHRIVEKPFDAHEYLLSKGFEKSREYNNECIEYQKYKDASIFIFHNGTLKLRFLRPATSYVTVTDWWYMKATQKYLDKAIKLVEFLIELEKE